MGKLSDMFPSKYLKSADLADLPAGQMMTLTIASVAYENASGNDQQPDNKPVLYFKGKEKGLVLNSTNGGVLQEKYSDDTDDLVGCMVALHTVDVMFRKEMVKGIRIFIQDEWVRAFKTRTQQQEPPAPTGNGPHTPVDESDIPF